MKSKIIIISWVLVGIKSSMTLIMCLIIMQVFNTRLMLQNEFEELSFWEITEHVYRVTGGFHIGSGLFEEIYLIDKYGEDFLDENGNLLPEYYHFFFDEHGEPYRLLQNIDFASTIEQEQRLVGLFLKLEEEKDAFLLEPFAFFNVTGEDGNIMYSYERDNEDRKLWMTEEILESMNSVGDPFVEWHENGLLDMVGRSILISRNYLLLNPIYDVYGNAVLDLLDSNPLSLNVLLPESYLERKEEMRAYFKDIFYFERITSINESNIRLGLPLVEETKSDLNINFIITTLNQSYFSFDRQIGDEKSLIWDPIVVLQNNYVSSSVFEPRVHQLMHIINDTKEGAFNSLSYYLDEFEIDTIHLTLSIFQRGNENLIALQWLILEQTLNLTMISLFFVISTILIIWSFYATNASTINLQYLLGYSFIQRNFKLLYLSILSTIIGFLIYVVFNDLNYLLLIIIALVVIIDFLMIYILGNYLLKKQVARIIKGGDL